ncbi:MAG: sugar ABC transporter ATP-binding protein [Lachnospiraceae bacterium]|nr:sugar ABC transporter ATP-binding protein [Lachnospiraceae bacterium]
MANKSVIKLTGISKSFAGVKALQDIDLDIKEGEIRCLAGGNGCGKSTVIKIISGFYQPDKGTIEIDGKEYSHLNPQQAIDMGIQVIYQDFSVFPNLTVAENIALSAERLDGKKFVNWKRVRERAQEAMDMININLDLDAILSELPVASKQLVAICRSLLQNARLLILDEPTTALTKNEVKSLFKVIKDLQAKGISILFVSHKIEEVYEIAKELTIFRNGKKVIEGSLQEFDRKKFVYYMTGREIETVKFQPKNIGKQPLFEVQNIGIKDLFKDVSFQLYPGEILGITGLLGSGRSELAKSLLNLEKITEGRILLEGKELKTSSVKDMIDAGIAYVPEDRLTEGLFMPQTISRNMIAAVIERNLNRLTLIDDAGVKERSEQWVEELKVKTPSTELPVQALSGGNQQKVVIAKWLSTNPKVLILNSPTVGIDVGAKADIYDYTRMLASKGMGIIIISDDIPEVIDNCNRVLVMKKGRITDELSTEGLEEDTLSDILIDANKEVAAK